jgi:protein-tyrosine phosphatase
MVFVCKGNICRSPFAEAVARAAGANAVSYGLDARRGLPANPSAIRAARKLGYSLDAHRTKPFREAILAQGDLVIAMEPWQIARIDDQFAEAAGRTGLLGMWSIDPVPYLFDPYGMRDSDFDRCFASIELATQRLVRGN